MRPIIISIFAVLILAGCAIPMESREMQPQFDFYDTVDPQKFRDAIYIRDVEVEEGLGGASPVLDEEFRDVLISSFRKAHLLEEEEEKAAYIMDARMVEMDQPITLLSGFNLIVSTAATYSVYRQPDGGVIFEETVRVPCTRGLGDAYDSEIRLRLASGCAVGENITHIINLLAREQ